MGNQQMPFEMSLWSNPPLIIIPSSDAEIECFYGITDLPLFLSAQVDSMVVIANGKIQPQRCLLFPAKRVYHLQVPVNAPVALSWLTVRRGTGVLMRWEASHTTSPEHGTHLCSCGRKTVGSAHRLSHKLCNELESSHPTTPAPETLPILGVMWTRGSG